MIRNHGTKSLIIKHPFPFTSPEQFDTSRQSDLNFITTIDYEGNIINQVSSRDTPTELWLMNIGDDDSLRLVVNYLSRTLSIFDTDLNTVAENINYENVSLSYRQRITIAGEPDSIYVFNDGFYDKSFEKILQFPFHSSHFHTVEYDTLGNVLAFAIENGKEIYIASVERKSFAQLASVFYHRNQNYILMFLTGLLVGLVSVNHYRRSNKNNLLLISKQKGELEKTHTALRKAQATIVEQEKFRQAKNIAGGFAHEIRNSLFPAQSALSKIRKAPQQKLADTNWVQEMTDFSDRAIARAIDLTQLISQYTRLEADKQTEPVCINEIIEQVLRDNKFRIQNSKITTRYAASSTNVVMGSQKQMYTVVNNLVLNAIDALAEAESPTIVINCERKADSVFLEIGDNGSGISEQDLDKVFDVFFTTKPNSGSGLGLALVKKILNMYDNRVSIQSCVGKGTTVRLELRPVDGDKHEHA